MPFHNGLSILQIIIHNLQRVLPKESIIVATSVNSHDDPIEAISMQEGIRCFRGDEDDVLDRFLSAAELFNADPVIRVCADNPFLRWEYIDELISTFQKDPCDYMTYEFPDGTPIMRSHIGLFAEIMSANFLRKLHKTATDQISREHVTVYVYDHREEFNTRFLPVPELVASRRDIRLTIDTEADFKSSSVLYSQLMEKDQDFSVEDLIIEIDSKPDYLSVMKSEIALNSK